MRLIQSVRVGALSLIALNLIMAFGSIWVFMRMAPAIEIIIDRNQVSLEACEEMLASLVMTNIDTPEASILEISFEDALTRAQNNITENDEQFTIELIAKNYQAALEGDYAAMSRTVGAILRLGEINRLAMERADKKARQFGYAGAWSVVFMASGVFVVGILFIRSFKRNLSNPLKEIHSVITAYQSGDTLRRCTGKDLPREITQVFTDLNNLLDERTLT